MEEPEDPIVLKILHTADWHLGRPFPSFAEPARLALSRARLDAVREIGTIADSYAVDAVLCAGDLFDAPRPDKAWIDGLMAVLAPIARPDRPVILLPGNHDPLMPGSVWHPDHPMRSSLPDNVHVVDRMDFELTIADHAVVLARPCTSTAGQEDPALALPKRAEGDERIRIGLVHGSTHEVPGFQMNYPLDPQAATKRGLDYLAIGDTHAFRIVPLRDGTLPHAPTVYPSAPEATNFGESDTGFVAVVSFRRRSRRATVRKVSVGRWTWRQEHLRSIDELRALCKEDLQTTVLKLTLDMQLSPELLEEAERLLADLEGGETKHALAGIVKIDRADLVLDTQSVERAFEGLPDVFRSAAARLRALEDGPDAPAARRALFHLYLQTRGPR